jgi:hypothetical protein
VDHPNQAGHSLCERTRVQRQARELSAQDYVYSITRRLDPNLKRGGDPVLTDLIDGARAGRRCGGQNLASSTTTPGSKACRPSIATRSASSSRRVDYTVLERLADLGSFAVAREAVEAAGAEVVSKPVGTGPFRLQEWTRGSRVILDANPHYRSDRVSGERRPGAEVDGGGR